MPNPPRKTSTNTRKPAKPRRKTFNGVLDAVLNGTRLDEITELRKIVARAIDEHATPKDLAALTKRLQDLTEEYENLITEEDKTNDPQSILTQLKPVELKAI